MQILNLRDAREYFDVVADRIWNAWWRGDGEPIDELAGELRKVVAEDSFPFTLVAVEDGVFAGTVTGIDADLDERPDLSPWVAALWVEPEFRKAGVARQLVAAAVERLRGLGHDPIYLHAVPSVAPLYRHLGWTMIEEGVGSNRVTIFSLHVDRAGALA